MRTPVLLGIALSLLAVACTGQNPAPLNPTVLGMVEFTLQDDGGQIQSTAHWITPGLSTAAVSLTSSNLPVITPAGSATTSDFAGRRYLSASFNLQNPLGGAKYDNLTFHAVTVDNAIGGGSSLAGTSLRNLRDSGGAAITDLSVARGIKPTHKLVNLSGVMQVDASGADFQVFDPITEINPVQSAINAVPALNGHVTALSYGFVARKAANNPARGITAGQSGFVTLGLHFPIAASGDPGTLSLTYVVVNETTTRVSEAPEEQGVNSGALARAQALGAGVAVNALPGSTLSGARLVCPVTWATSSAGLPASTSACPPGAVGDFPIMFVTHLPIRADFTTIGSTFGNHLPDLESVGRGGDLWMRYPDGSLKNLTKAAGFGSRTVNAQGFTVQDGNAIAVRDPAVSWDGTKAVFSMVVGLNGRWQLFEVTGLGKNDTPTIKKVANQPNFNNVSPTYGTDDRIIFTSDLPRTGNPADTHLYPQRDEYEEQATVTGLWSLEPSSGNLKLLNHAPSGNFTPFVDSFGRVVFTQWDHLQRDQQLGNDGGNCNGSNYGLFNFASEAANAAKLNDCSEVFPEPHGNASERVPGTNYYAHSFNLFMPWTILEDGSEGEVLNHVGRHEVGGFAQVSFFDDPNLTSSTGQQIEHFFHLKENPLEAGSYFATNAQEFGTHSGGEIVSLKAPPSLNPENIKVQTLTVADSGQYRDPLPLASGGLIAAHTATNALEGGGGTFSTLYKYRLKTLGKSGQTYTAGATLTPGNGLEAKISYSGTNFDGALWELNPVEVRARPRPARLTATLPTPETHVFERLGVNPAALRTYLEQNDLALIISRNVTSRDDADRQQPFNLRVPGGVESISKPGKVYDVTHLQMLQADGLRGTGGINSPKPGRRVLAQTLHDAKAVAANKPVTGPSGSVAIASDGSIAAFVPARRALSWQLTNASGLPVVRERFWVTFQPGEVRVCGSCHGVNAKDQLGGPPPVTEPKALEELLTYWKNR